MTNIATRSRAVSTSGHGTGAKAQSAPTQMRGFSMVEMAIVVAIILILLSAAIFSIKTTLRESRADTANAYVANQIRTARERAIDERRIYQLAFAPPNQINLLQGNTGGGGAIVYTPVSTILLPFDMTFVLPPAPPLNSPDSLPDPKDMYLNAIDMRSANGTTTTLYFHPDGTSQDVTGALTNGVVYMGRANDNLSIRAVSLFGSTGSVKQWRMAAGKAGNIWSVQ